MAEVHGRMPVILDPGNYDRWLDRGERQRPPVDLLKPYDADSMARTFAHPKVGSVRNQGPEMVNSS